jgi:hypothetical protein
MTIVAINLNLKFKISFSSMANNNKSVAAPSVGGGRPHLVTIRREADKVKNFPEYWRMIDETISLTFNNKVNIKNAFDIDINCIDNLSALITQQKGDNSWGRTGEALGAGAKIYGFRVDNVHMETYRILGGLHRHGMSNEEELEALLPKVEGESDDYN